MKNILIALALIALSGCGDKFYTNEEIVTFKKNVDCTGYPDKQDFSNEENNQLRKASIEQCEHFIFFYTDAIKKSPK
jgi:UDP-N-acetylglucosamine:LPS N-acetylglucosamine transferase